MDNSEYMESRVESPLYFRAPESLLDSCSICGLCIMPGQICSEFMNQISHLNCIEMELAEAGEPND